MGASGHCWYQSSGSSWSSGEGRKCTLVCFVGCRNSGLKRCTTWELKVKFYLGENEDCSPGGITSDSSGRLLQRGSWRRSIYKILVKGEFNTIKSSFYKRFSASQEDLMSLWRFSVLLDMRRCKDLLLLSCSIVSSSCNPMGCSMPGFPVLHNLLEFTQIHVQWVSDAI